MHNSTIVDTHAHLCDSVFDSDLKDVLERAKAAGVSAIISVSETRSDVLRNLELSAYYPELHPAAGLYPAHLDLSQAEEILVLIRKEHRKLWAIGEVGLDFWIAKEDAERELQREIFSRFIDVAIEFDLPLNVHSRSAGRHAIALLLERGARQVQLHAFDGKSSTALPAVEAGYFFSVPPSIIRSRQKQKLVTQLPLSSLLLETDSPVLGSSPNERNEPANILTAVDLIAELKHVHREEVLMRVYENTRELYNRLPLISE